MNKEKKQEDRSLLENIIPKLTSPESVEYVKEALKEIREFYQIFQASENISPEDLNRPMTI